MKVEGKAEVTYRVTLEYTDEEASNLRRAVDFIQRMLPARDDGLEQLRDAFTPGRYREVSEFEVGDIDLCKGDCCRE